MGSFLYQAWSRNRAIADSPYIAFPHGSVSLGYDKKDGRSGPAGWYSKATKGYFEPSKLLYPVTKKNYAQDEFVIDQWEMIKSFLSDKAVKQVTIFGYGAPETDKEAMKLLNEAWGTGQNRADEQFEIIDIRPEKKVMKQWKNFIYSGHTDYTIDYFKSSLAYNPRRTFESYHQHYFPMTIEEAFSASNPVPSDFKTLQELWGWHKPLIDAELKHKNQQANK